MANEFIEKAKECKSAEELQALAKENGIEMTAEAAAEKFAQLHNEGELSDNELNGAAGGGCKGMGEESNYRGEGGCPNCGYRRGYMNDKYDMKCMICEQVFTFEEWYNPQRNGRR